MSIDTQDGMSSVSQALLGAEALVSSEMAHVHDHDHDHSTHGSFRGHALPGALFIALGVHWVLAVMTHAAREMGHGVSGSSASSTSTGGVGVTGGRETDVESQSAAQNQQQNAWLHGMSRPYYSPEYLPRCVTALLPPLRRAEPILIAALAGVGIIVELFFHPGNTYYRQLYIDGELADEHLNVWQHAVMYLGFGVSGVASLCFQRLPMATLHHHICGGAGGISGGGMHRHRHYHYTHACDTTGSAIAFVVLALAFVNEATLFGFHLADGRDAIAAVDHTLLTYTIAATAAVIFAQAAIVTSAYSSANSFVLSCARGYLTALQGTWFYQIGMNEYSNQHKLDANKMGHVMFVPVLFCIHAIAILVVFLALYYLMVARRSAPSALMVSQSVPNASDSDSKKKIDACRLR